MTAIEVREARPGEESTARGILNAAMLEVDDATLERATLLVAVDGDRMLGALVLDGSEIDAVAVRPGRRDQGVGTALVESASSRREELTAGFDPGVRPFYESLGFDVTRCGEEAGDDRCRGTLR